MRTGPTASSRLAITVVLNWFGQLKRGAATN